MPAAIAFQPPVCIGLQPFFRHCTSSRAGVARCGQVSARCVRVSAVFQAPVETQVPRTMPLQRVDLKAVFFDLDGTCVNSDHIHYEAYRDTLLEMVPAFNGGKPISRAFYDAEMSGRQNPELVANILPELSHEQQEALWKTKEQQYEQVISQGVPPINGLLDILTWCKAKNLTTYVVTNAPKASCIKTMDAIGISQHFANNVVVAEECEHPKPHPAPYLRALQLAGIQPNQAVVFEDSPSGTKSACAAQILTIGILSTQKDTTLRQAGAAFTIADYTSRQLRQQMEQWLRNNATLN